MRALTGYTQYHPSSYRAAAKKKLNIKAENKPRDLTSDIVELVFCLHDINGDNFRVKVPARVMPSAACSSICREPRTAEKPLYEAETSRRRRRVSVININYALARQLDEY